MKRIIFIFLLTIGAFEASSQDNHCFSVELGSSTCHYFLGDNKTNDFNHGFSFMVSDKVRRVKVSAGVGYYTKYFHSDNNPTISIEKYNYYLRYLSFPIVANIEVLSHNKFYAGLLAGIVVNNIVDYRIETLYQNGDARTENDLLEDKQVGISPLLGVTFSTMIGKRCNLNIYPYMRYNLIVDHKDQPPVYSKIPDDKISLGLRIGVEYLFGAAGK